MTFDWTISLGHILTIIGFVGTAVGVIFAVRRDVSVLSARLEPIEEAVKALTAALTDVARHDERIKAVERDVQRLDPRLKWGQPGSR